MHTAVIVPTLNEQGNIEDLLEQILKIDGRLYVVIVDDGSTDGTIETVKTIALKYTTPDGERVHLLERGRKLGYASAVQDGMRYALNNEAQIVVYMDADFSHDPKYIPELLKQSEAYDLVLGSRYVKGGGTRHWGLDRKLLSGGGNLLVRVLLHLPVRDCTGGFRCLRRELIEKSGILELRVEGYAFQFLTLDRYRQSGARITEVPIIFADRQHGKSKMSTRIIREATRALFALWWKRLMRRA